MTEAGGLEAWRARVAEGHAHVEAGRYDAAIAAFALALPALRAALGAQHEEVVELGLDLDAVRSMRDVSGLVAEIGRVDPRR